MARNAPHLCGKDADGYEENKKDELIIPISNNQN
jgi:hypothetical protein